MKILITYDSYFGNTEQISLAIGKGIAKKGDVQIKRVGDVRSTDLSGLDYLFVGSPTRRFTATKAINDFIKDIPEKGLTGIKTVAFDTRLDIKKINNRFLTLCVKLFGYASAPLDYKLRNKGGYSVLPPEGFFVLDTRGPLGEGEYERAVEWAKSVLSNPG
jgi:flavodoxin I